MPGRGRGLWLKSNVATKPVILSDDRDYLVKKAATKPNCTNNKNSEQHAVRVLAKYSYKANPDSPGGFKELSMKQGEELVLINESAEQPHWWCVRNQLGEQGFCPKSYLMKVEEKVNTLPWLEKKGLDTEELASPAVPTVYKTYISAYQNKSAKSEETWHCDICNKPFNGPHPYNSHMASKAHKEEVELAEYYGRK